MTWPRSHSWNWAKLESTPDVADPRPQSLFQTASFWVPELYTSSSRRGQEICSRSQSSTYSELGLDLYCSIQQPRATCDHLITTLKNSEFDPTVALTTVTVLNGHIWPGLFWTMQKQNFPWQKSLIGQHRSRTWSLDPRPSVSPLSEAVRN